MKKKLILVLAMFILINLALVACVADNPRSPVPEPEESSYASVPTDAGDMRVLAMSASLTSVLAILEDGSLWIWEDFDDFDEQSREWIIADWSTPPVWIMDNVIHVVAGPYHHLAIDADNVLWAWGENHERGKIGDGTTEPRPYPVRIMENVVYAAISPVSPNAHVGDGVRSYAITEDGALWAWGQNGSAEWPVVLGDGTDIPRSSPVWIMDHVSSVTPTREGAYAITEDGIAWWWGERWGWNDTDDPDANPNDTFWREVRLYPVRVDESEYVSSDWRRLNFHYEIDESGTLWTWGENQLPGNRIYMPLVGDGTTEARTSPVQIMDHVISVTVIADTVFAIDSSGTLWAWGPNNIGQLGDGTTETRLSPVRIMGNVEEISTHYFMDHGGVGFMNTFVLAEGGQLWRIGSLQGHGSSVSQFRGEPELLPIRLHPSSIHSENFYNQLLTLAP